MKNKKYTFTFFERVLFYILPTAQQRLKWLKKKKIFALIGENVFYQPRKYPSDHLRVKIHDNVCITAGVEFTAHDMIYWVQNGMEGEKKHPEYRGCIEIYENCFIGAGTRILPNVSIGPNAIVGAGALITKDVPAGSVVGGVPAKVIGSFDEVMAKRSKWSSEHKDACSNDRLWEEFYKSRSNSNDN